MKRSIALFFLCGFFADYSTGQGDSKIDDYLSHVYQKHVMPGFSAVVVNEHKTLYTRAFGYLDLDDSIAYRTNTIGQIGSLTKSITALAMLQLVEAGQLTLDDPIKEYIPEFSSASPKQSDQITVRMLLNNTSGLNGEIRPSYELSENSIQAMIANLSNLFISEMPGSSYAYSNIGFSLGGLIISRVSGLSYSSYIAKNIFQPLGMVHSSVLPWQHTEQVAIGHFPGIDHAIPSYQYENFGGEFIPAGKFAQSTVIDLAKYLTLYLNAGYHNGEKIISEDLLQRMWQPEISFMGLSEKDGGDGEKSHYGLGWMISHIDGRKIIHHAGSTGTNSSFTMIDPEQQLAVAMLINLDLTMIDRYSYPFGLNIVNNILHLASGHCITDFAIPRRPDPTLNNYELPKGHLVNYIGEYRHSKGGDHFVYYDKPDMVISSQNGILKSKMTRNDQIINQFELDFISPTLSISRNIASPSQIRFKLDKSGKIKGAFCLGMEFRKIATSGIVQYQESQLGPVTMFAPQEWHKTFDQEQITFSNPKEPGYIVQCYLTEPVMHTRIEGSQGVERIRRITWQKHTSYLIDNTTKHLVTTYTTKLKNLPISLEFISDPSNHSYFLQKEILPFLERIQVEVAGI